METPECPKPLSLDEAIAHADEVAGDCGTACKREHKQLADWLRELKSRRIAERVTCARMRDAIKKVIEIADKEWDAFRETSAMWEMRDICIAALAAAQKEGGE